MAVVTSGMPVLRIYTRTMYTEVRNFDWKCQADPCVCPSVCDCLSICLTLRVRPIPEAIWASLTMVINFRRKLGI